MGTDKANLVQDGETLLLRTVRLARLVSEFPPLIVGREKPDDWGEHVLAQFVPDDSPGIGPVGGLQTALRHARGIPVLALSCDLPALTEPALRWLVSEVRGKYGVIARNGDQLEPLFAVYSPSCLPLIEANIGAGKRSLHALIAAGGEGFAVRDVPPDLASTLANVNTPEQWAIFRRPARSLLP